MRAAAGGHAVRDRRRVRCPSHRPGDGTRVHRGGDHAGPRRGCRVEPRAVDQRVRLRQDHRRAHRAVERA